MKKWFAGLLACGMFLLMTSVEGKVESWRDYEDGDQIQVTIDGVTYLVHASDAVLMTKEPE